MSMPFSIDTYWEPEKGRIICQSCGSVIRIFNEKLNTWLKLANYRTKEVALSDGSMASMKLCSDCLNVDVDDEKDSPMAKRVKDQFVKAFQKSGRLEEANDFKKLDVVKSIKNEFGLKKKIALSKEAARKFKLRKAK